MVVKGKTIMAVVVAVLIGISISIIFSFLLVPRQKEAKAETKGDAIKVSENMSISSFVKTGSETKNYQQIESYLSGFATENLIKIVKEEKWLTKKEVTFEVSNPLPAPITISKDTLVGFVAGFGKAKIQDAVVKEIREITYTANVTDYEESCKTTMVPIYDYAVEWERQACFEKECNHPYKTVVIKNESHVKEYVEMQECEKIPTGWHYEQHKRDEYIDLKSMSLEPGQKKRFIFMVKHNPISDRSPIYWNFSLYVGSQNLTIDPWWTPDVKKRINITVNNSLNPTPLLNYHVMVNISYDSDMQADFSDLRFTWLNKSDSTEIELQFWQERYVASSWSVFWLKVPNVTAAGYETVYAYYKNVTTLSGGSNGYDTFIFFDDFRSQTAINSTKWETSTGGAGGCVGGTVSINHLLNLSQQGTGTSTNGICAGVRSKEKFSAENTSLEFNATFSSASGASWAWKHIGWDNSTLSTALTTCNKTAAFPNNCSIFGTDNEHNNMYNGLPLAQNTSPPGIVATNQIWGLILNRTGSYTTRNRTHNKINVLMNPYNTSMPIMMAIGDNAGNNAILIYWLFVRKHIAPDPTVIVNTTEETYQGYIPIEVTLSSPINTTYGSATITINGSLNANGNVTWQMNSEANQTACKMCTAFSNITSVGVVEGPNTLKVYAVNSTNSSDWSVANVTFTVDRTQPLIKIWSPSNETIYDSYANLNVTANEPISQWWYSVNDGSNISFTPNATFYAPNGTNTIRIYANDTVGNENFTDMVFTVIQCPDDPGWWNSSFKRRQKICLSDTGGFARTNEPYDRWLNSSGYAQSDCDDFRVISWNGSSWTEYPSAVYNCSNGNGNVAWLANVSPASNRTYYIYYNFSSVPMKYYEVDPKFGLSITSKNAWSIWNTKFNMSASCGCTLIDSFLWDSNDDGSYDYQWITSWGDLFWYGTTGAASTMCGIAENPGCAYKANSTCVISHNNSIFKEIHCSAIENKTYVGGACPWGNAAHVDYYVRVFAGQKYASVRINVYFTADASGINEIGIGTSEFIPGGTNTYRWANSTSNFTNIFSTTTSSITNIYASYENESTIMAENTTSTRHMGLIGTNISILPSYEDIYQQMVTGPVNANPIYYLNKNGGTTFTISNGGKMNMTYYRYADSNWENILNFGKSIEFFPLMSSPLTEESYESIPPLWSNMVSSTPVEYSANISSHFNITWIDVNSSISTVFIELNATGKPANYTMNHVGNNVYSYSAVLPGNGSYWKSYANDTKNNWNTSATAYFLIYSSVVLASNCSLYPYPALNITLWNESTRTMMNGTVEISFDIWNRSGFIQNYSFKLEGSPNYTICISDPNTTYTMNAIAQYYAPNYFTREYNIHNMKLSGSVNEVRMYLLHQSLGSRIRFTIKDSAGTTQPDVLMHIQRYYPDTNSYVTIALPKTDALGQTNTYLVPYDVWHKFILMRNGVILDTITPMFITSDDITLIIRPTGIIEYFRYYDQVAHNCTYVNSTSTLICSIANTNGVVTSGCLKVWKSEATSDTTICDSCESSSSFTIGCYLGDNPSGTYAYALNITTAFNPVWYVIAYSGTIDIVTVATYVLEGVVASILIIGVCATIGIWNPTVSIILTVSALIIVAMFGFIPAMWGSIASIACVGIVLIFRLRT